MEEYQPIGKKVLFATCKQFFEIDFRTDDRKLGAFLWFLGDYGILAYKQIYNVQVVDERLEVYGLLSHKHHVAIVRRVVFNRRMQVIQTRRGA